MTHVGCVLVIAEEDDWHARMQTSPTLSGCVVFVGSESDAKTITGAEPPRGSGVALPMAGMGIGCVQFAGLTNALSASTTNGTSARKALVQVSIDPLHPIDTTRNYQIFTGQDYVLTDDGGIYRLTPVT